MRRCIVCQCTDDMACSDELLGPCHWARTIGKTKGICSNCPAPAKNLTPAQRRERKQLLEKVKRIERHRRLMAQNFHLAQEGYERAVEDLRNFEVKAAA